MDLYNAARAASVRFATEAVPKEGQVEASGLSLRYLSWGDPALPPLLLLHGLAQTAHSWDFVSLSLCDGFRVVALDHRGHGDSEWAADGDYSLEANVRDLGAVICGLALQPVSIMGLSLGGKVAMTYAAERPEEVCGLVVVDAAPEHQRAGVAKVRRFVEEADELDSFGEFVERVRRYNPRRSTDQIRGSLEHNLMQLPNGKWTWKYDRALRSRVRDSWTAPGVGKALWRSAGRVACPTLLVRGEDSEVVSPEMAELLCRTIPDCRLVTVQDAGHLVPGDNPAGFLKAVRPFLEQLDAGVTGDRSRPATPRLS